jgi:NADH-quinone oxidoreductase chain I
MIWPLLKGLGLTLKAFFSKPVTIQYPEEKRPPSPRWRGTHYFEVLPDGDTKCVACGLCVTVCPPKAIRLVAVERDDGRRYPEVYELDAIRCIYCGLCEEACPVNAIKLSTITNLVGYRREELKWDKGRLIERRKEKEEMG